MPRKPKPKNQLSAGQRAALYLEEQEEKLRSMSAAEPEVIEEPKPKVRKKVEKPKPESAIVRVDMSALFDRNVTLHGMCNGPVSYDSNITGLFRQMKTPYVRNSNSDTVMSKYAFDISRIFPDKNADDSDPASYDFALTDKYVMGIYNSGARCIFRLGDSDRDSSFALSDPDKWVRVCQRVIKHYNDYWANGFAYGIKHFEICPMGDFSSLDPKADIFSLYEKTALAIKLIDSEYLVGGMSFDGYCDRAREFLRFCSVKNIPLDFVSVTAFCNDIEDFCDDMEKLTSVIMNQGLVNTYIMVSAWNYVKEPGDNISGKVVIKNESGEYSKQAKELFDAQKSIEGAAFCSSMLVALSSLDRVLYACYYDAQPAVSKFCGICDRFGNPEKPYYAFCAYSNLATSTKGVMCVSHQSPDMKHTGVWAIAGAGDDGYKVMISSFDGCPLVDLRLENIPDDVYNAEIYMSDGVKNMELCDTVALSGVKKRLLLSVSRYGYVQIKIY